MLIILLSFSLLTFSCRILMVQTAKQMLDKKIIVKNLAKIGTFE